MKLVIVPSINLPLPPVKGGAVQNLIRAYLDENEQTGNDDITVFSIYDSDAEEEASNYKHCRFVYVQQSALLTDLSKDGIRGVRGASIRYLRISYLRTIISWLRNHSCDMVLLENTPEFVEWIREAIPKKCRLYLHLHNDWVNSSTKRAERKLEDLDKVICVSDFIASRVRTVGAGTCIETVHNGVPTTMKQFGSKEIHEIRHELGIEDELTLIFTGRLVPEKGIDKLIEAMAKLGPNAGCKLLVLGSKLYGENITDKFLEGLKSTIRESHLEKAVVFTGYIDYEKIPLYYRSADVGILPSIWDDPCPLTILECMKYGLPIVTTESGGIPELVDNKCAFVFDRDEDLPKNIAVAIRKLRDDRGLLNQMSEASRRRSEQFSMQAYLCNIFNAIHN